MKILYILRHAKSSWDHPGLADRKRPLNPRGQRALVQMAAAGILDRNGSFSIYSSPARRARDTIEGIVRLSPGEHPIEIVEALYTFDVRDLLAWLRQQDDAQAALMIVGHNPALEDLVTVLVGCELEKFPTCAFAALHIASDRWDGVSPQSAQLAEFIKPEKDGIVSLEPL